MEEATIKEIFAWDVVNWSKAMPLWEKHINDGPNKLKCLELGSNYGGLSLWLALKGHQVICSDLKKPDRLTAPFHSKYGNLPISYQSIDALDIPYENEFDVVVFKSILGGVSRGRADGNKIRAIEQMNKALKPGGKLLFAENLTASMLHETLRKHFVKWGNDWNYLHVDEVASLFSSFNSLEYETVGFFGAFGRTEKQRNILGRLDSLIDPILNDHMKYIVFGAAEKKS